MEDYILMKPTNEYAEQIATYRREFLEAGDSMDGTGPLRRMDDPNEYIKFCAASENPDTVPDNLVPATQLILIRTADNRLVGMIQIRHYLNDYLEKFGGHIGYSVRPTERQKSYATIMLNKALPFCEEIGIKKVLITCIDGNVGSEKTIVANGGVYESTVYESTADIHLKRFWIALDGDRIIATSGMSFVEKPPYFGCPSGKMGLLSSMFTNPDYRRQGIAKELLARVIHDAKEYGGGTVQITASDMGVRLYTDFGFIHNGNFMQYKL